MIAKKERDMPVYRYDHVHIRSGDPDAMAAWFERLFGAEIGRGTYAPVRSIRGGRVCG